MEFSIKTSAPEKLKTACLVIGAFAQNDLDGVERKIDDASQGSLGRILAAGDLDEKAGATLLIHALPGIAASRVLVVSLGKRADFNAKAYRTALTAVGKALAKGQAKDAAICLAHAEVPDHDMAWKLRMLSMLVAEAAYSYDAPRAKKEAQNKGADRIDVVLTGKASETARTALARGHSIAQGMSIARDLGNAPANVCTPSYLAATAKSLAKTYKLKVEVLDRPALQRLGMGSFLAVAQGSHQPPKFIILEYKGGKAKQAPIVLVGKGVTFDTGGISLKPGEGMDEMKYDMCGAASVLGTFQAVAQMQLPINLVGLIPTTENMPGGGAIKPGDVVKSMSGQTIEILNTDAEGRLILCDALTYAERFKPACVIDIATLTGACIIALGHHPSGVLANDDALARELMDIGQTCGDRAWQLPLWDDYQDQLKSNFADMGNIGGRPAGTITAACFLSRYTKNYKWAHLDIAGTAWKSGAEKGATGRPVPLLTHFLINRAQNT